MDADALQNPCRESSEDKNILDGYNNSLQRRAGSKLEPYLQLSTSGF